MHILVLHSGVDLYGSDKSLIENIESLREAVDCEITAVMHKDGELRPELSRVCDKVEIYNYGVLSRNDLSTHPFKSLISVIHGGAQLLCRLRSVDIVYVNTLPVFSAYVAFPFLRKTKKMFFVREIPTGFQRYVFSVLLKISRAHLIFNSNNTKNAFLGLKRSKTYVLPNCVSVNLHEKDLKLSNRCDEAKQLNILLLGRIYPLKGQDVALRAVYDLKNRGVEFKLRIIGGVADGREDYLAYLRDLIDEFGLHENVIIEDFEPKVDGLYRWADVVLVPSVIPESFGRTVVEGMAFGCIVVAADHGGPAEIIDHGVNGILCKPGCPKALSEGIEKMSSDLEMRRSMSRNAQAYYRDNFTPDIYKRNVKKIMEKIT